MKPTKIVLLVAILVALAWWIASPFFERASPKSAPVVAESAKAFPSNLPAVPSASAASPAIGPVHPTAARFGSSAIEPESEPTLLLDLLQAHRRLTGEFPTGEDNRAVMEVLTRPTARAPALFPKVHPRINARGELLDAWGTPFFFHHLSRHDIEVRSAGPDREFFTADDILVASSGGLSGHR